jgi:hypothetical protein
MTSTLNLLARAAFLLVIAIATHALHAQQAPRSEFIVKKGKDTVAVEIFTRDASTLTSEIYQSAGVRTQYTINLRRDSSAQHVELTRQGRQGAGAGVSVHFADTLVTAVVSAGSEAEKFEFPTSPGKATPFLAVSFALAEQVVFASHLAVGKSRVWTACRLAAGDTATLTVTRFHADSVLLAMAEMQIKLALSPKGEVIGGRHLGQDWLVERKTVK